MFQQFLNAAANDYSKAMRNAAPSVAQMQLIAAYNAVNTCVKADDAVMSLAVNKKYGEVIRRYVSQG